MASTQKYKKIVLHNEGYITGMREPGERIRTVGVVHIDRSVFKHGAGEKALLKELRLQAKREEMKK